MGACGAHLRQHIELGSVDAFGMVPVIPELGTLHIKSGVIGEAGLAGLNSLHRRNGAHVLLTAACVVPMPFCLFIFLPICTSKVTVDFANRTTDNAHLAVTISFQCRLCQQDSPRVLFKSPLYSAQLQDLS